ncbi:carboxymuconolactone decarboxylase family protein [Syntrophaceticus schinkii]|jgi:alkylhydroperoxidase/carboxymuconolactone decarboxylase family protein YurZ|uniref:Alkylhydroperoxidase AhpD core (Modular protein) n=1 Tax=Syntrophaceticus schinkii TaxID=499207 RepID=A0A0B7MEF8_9FIRM|nr:carboxymuconolactone decarboxylase family protein [Syntrophaceticus schinkii]CEO88964.1 Alkylhydroperoxidase AhpD core (modular protein) [Syntrophaceticus schinkii]
MRIKNSLVIENYQEVKHLANFPPFVQELGKRDKEFYDAVTKVIEVATRPGAVDEKTKVFISLALDAYIGSERGVMVLANRARELGATEEEINEVLRIPYYVAGSRPLITGNNAFPKKE